MERTVVKRFGPDPSRQFYKLHESLLWSDIPAAPRLVLIDLFHREAKGDEIPPIGERAKALHMSRDTVERAEAWLAEHDYLLRHMPKGKHGVYLAAYPAIPKGSKERTAFEAGFQKLVEEAQNLPQNAVTPCRKMRQLPTAKCGNPLPQNAVGSREHTLLSDSKTKKTLEDSAASTSPVIEEPKSRPVAKPQQHPPSQADPIQRNTDLYQQARTLFNACSDAFGLYYGNPPTGPLKAELIDAFEFHLKQGRTITPEHVAEAVRIQQQQDRERGRIGIKRYASAILPTLGEVVVKAFEKQQIEARAEAHHDGTERRLQQRDAYARRLSPEQKAAQQALFQRLRQIQRDTPEWHALSDWEMGIWRTMHGFLSQSHAAAH